MRKVYLKINQEKYQSVSVLGKVKNRCNLFDTLIGNELECLEVKLLALLLKLCLLGPLSRRTTFSIFRCRSFFDMLIHLCFYLSRQIIIFFDQFSFSIFSFKLISETPKRCFIAFIQSQKSSYKQKLMNSSQSDILESPLPIYLIKVNTSAFDPKRCNLLQRTKERYLPHYWNQMHLDQKRISPSSQDRLSQLTTGQIDRLIDLEKIHTSLNSKKQKLKQEFFTFKPKNVNSHANTYQACFLSKINQIAIKKNIRHESADIGIYVGGDSNRSKKKVAKVPFKYRKSYEIDSPNHGKSRNHYAQVDDQKSIASIEDDLDGFQKKIQEERDQGNELRVTKISIESLESRRSRRKSFCPAGVKKKWFYGLSKVLTQPQEKKAEATPKQQSLGRSVKIDIESQMTPPPIPYSNNSLKNHFHERSHSTGIETYDCPYVPLKKYKLPRLITVN